MFYIKIPVKRHVLKYIEARYRVPYTIDGQDFLGMTLINFLRRPIVSNHRMDAVLNYDNQLTVILRRKDVTHYGMLHALDPNSVSVFNHKFDKIIDELFIAVVNSRVDLGQRYKQAIMYFLDNYPYFDHSSDSFHMLQKRYYRYRKRKQKKFGKSLPTLSTEKIDQYAINFT